MGQIPGVHDHDVKPQINPVVPRGNWVYAHTADDPLSVAGVRERKSGLKGRNITTVAHFLLL